MSKRKPVPGSKRERVLIYIKGLPDPKAASHDKYQRNCAKNDRKALQVSPQYFYALKTECGYGGKMTAKRRKKHTHDGSKKKAILAYLQKHPTGTHAQFCREVSSVRVHEAYFSKVKRGRKAKRKQVKRTPVTAEAMQSAYAEENEYLRWLLQGERKGWLDRFLRESESGTL